MHEKDPGFWMTLLDMLSPETKAAIMAMFIAFLRIVYDRKENQWQRIALESMLCGVISYAVASGLSFGLSFFYEKGSAPNEVADLAVFCGGAIGLLGVEFVRAKARRYISKKADKPNEPA